MNSWRREFDRIGGPFALSTPVIITAWVVFILGTLSVDVLDGDAVTIPSLVIGTLSASVGAAFAFAARFWMPVRNRPARTWLAIATFMATGAVRVLCTGGLTSLAGLELDPSAGDRLFPSAVQCAVVMGAVAMIVDRSAEHRVLYEVLLNERQRLLLLRESFEESIALARIDLEREVHDVLDPTIAQIRELLRVLGESGAQDLGAASELLSSAVAGVVRPLSHALIAQRDDASVGAMTIRVEPEPTPGLPRTVDVPDSIRPGWVVGVNLALLAATVPILGVQYVALLLAIPFTPLMWAALAAVRYWWPRRRPKLPLGWALMALLAVYTLTSGVLFWAQVVVTSVAGWSFSGHLWPWMTRNILVGMIVSVVFIVDRRRRDDESDLALVNAELAMVVARRRTELWSTRRKMSYVLHGSVQSSLVSAAVALAQPGVDVTRIDSLRTSIDEAVMSIDLVDAQATSIELALAQIVSLWGFACHVDVSIDASTVRILDRDPAAATAVGEIVREGVSNAVRHGHAASIAVEIHPLDDGLLRVRVDDDGAGLVGDLSPGLGSLMLDEVTFRWSRAPLGTGSRLEALLALG